jgi:hypothetical protein
MKRALVLTLAVAALAGCSGGSCPDPFYDGKASDEVWRTLLDAESRAKADDAKAVTLFFPSAGEKIPSANPPTFNWSTPLTAAKTRLPSPRPSLLTQVGGWVYGSAWAHLPPVTGPVHLLRIKVPKRTCPIELVTTRTEWIPSTEAWTQLKDTGAQTLSLDVFSAYLQENRISEGPFHLSKPLTFSVGP